jgi:hypothetical protein
MKLNYLPGAKLVQNVINNMDIIWDQHLEDITLSPWLDRYKLKL